MSGADRPRMIEAVSPLVPLIAGLVALAVAWWIRPSLGGRYRVGLLLSAAPIVSIAEARALAGGPPRYVQVAGRLDSETDFEDDAHRPLVFRRTRLQRWNGSGWTDLDDRRERVPFDLREGQDSIRIDDAQLDVGLVVVVRESEGTAGNVADRVPAGTDPRTPIRLRIEQVSSVEHAIVAGVPRLDAEGLAVMSSGLGRPLVLATMDRSDAMRVLAEGRPVRPILVAVAMIAGISLVVFGLLWALVAGLS
jgi:hypothetical protein